jgi:hypothetical protein
VLTEPYLLAGRYRLVQRLGEGGAGTVWRALDTMLDRQVAAKQVRVPDGLTPHQLAEFTGRAIHEARSAGRLRDPAIVMVHDVVLETGQPWIIMDLVAGRSLDKVIKEQGPLPPAEVARVGLRVLSALEIAHAHGMLHQDVKPANILLDADGSAMLTDFGIAAPLRGPDGHAGRSGAGSPGYMAPERLNQHAPGPSSDLWSLGASLYTAVEGRSPFERPSAAAVAAAVLLHEPPFPARAGTPLGDLIMAMLAKHPAARPAAAQVRETLAAVATAGRPVRRRWRVPVAIAAAVVVLGAAGSYGLSVLNRGPETGRFAAAPDPCTLITDGPAADLLKGRPARTATRPGECQWRIETGSRTWRTLTVRVRAERPAGDLSGPAIAERKLAGERTNRAGAEGEVFQEVTGKVRDVTGVGEAAIAQTTFKMNLSGERGRAESTVLFRLSNLVAEVHLHQPDVLVDTARAGGETAIGAARVVSAALKQ